MNEKLKEIESNIDLSIFHIKNRKKSKNNKKNRSDYDVKQETLRKQEKFRRTVLATKAIVSQKLYKIYSNSLEKYFNDKWKLSRAQVYRFLDCAKIIEKLNDFELQPYNERVCRSLNKLTKNTKYMRILWSEVLNSINNNLQLVNSVLVEKVYKDLISRNIIPSNASLLKVDDSEELNESANVIITKSSSSIPFDIFEFSIKSNSMKNKSNQMDKTTFDGSNEIDNKCNNNENVFINYTHDQKLGLISPETKTEPLITSPSFNNNNPIKIENNCISSPSTSISDIKDQKIQNGSNSPISLAIASQPKTQSNQQSITIGLNYCPMNTPPSQIINSLPNSPQFDMGNVTPPCNNDYKPNIKLEENNSNQYLSPMNSNSMDYSNQSNSMNNSTPKYTINSSMMDQNGNNNKNNNNNNINTINNNFMNNNNNNNNNIINNNNFNLRNVNTINNSFNGNINNNNGQNIWWNQNNNNNNNNNNNSNNINLNNTNNINNSFNNNMKNNNSYNNYNYNNYNNNNNNNNNINTSMNGNNNNYPSPFEFFKPNSMNNVINNTNNTNNININNNNLNNNNNTNNNNNSIYPIIYNSNSNPNSNPNNNNYINNYCNNNDNNNYCINQNQNQNHMNSVNYNISNNNNKYPYNTQNCINHSYMNSYPSPKVDKSCISAGCFNNFNNNGNGYNNNNNNLNNNNNNINILNNNNSSQGNFNKTVSQVKNVNIKVPKKKNFMDLENLI